MTYKYNASVIYNLLLAVFQILTVVSSIYLLPVPNIVNTRTHWIYKCFQVSNLIDIFGINGNHWFLCVLKHEKYRVDIGFFFKYRVLLLYRKYHLYPYLCISGDQLASRVIVVYADRILFLFFKNPIFTY